MATSGQAVVVKAGWMHRGSDLLEDWKRCYCILETSGVFSYFNNESLMEAEGQINLPRECFTLKVALDVRGLTVPNGSDVYSMIEIRTSQACTIFLADSADDAQTWKFYFENVIRANRAPPAPVPAPTYPYAQAPVNMINPWAAYYPNYGQSVPSAQRAPQYYTYQDPNDHTTKVYLDTHPMYWK